MYLILLLSEEWLLLKHLKDKYILHQNLQCPVKIFFLHKSTLDPFFSYLLKNEILGWGSRVW